MKAVNAVVEIGNRISERREDQEDQEDQGNQGNQGNQSIQLLVDLAKSVLLSLVEFAPIGSTFVVLWKGLPHGVKIGEMLFLENSNQRSVFYQFYVLVKIIQRTWLRESDTTIFQYVYAFWGEVFIKHG